MLMIPRYGTQLILFALLLATSGQLATATTIQRQAEILPNPSRDDPPARPGDYFGGPPEGEVQMVASGIGYGGPTSAPTNYPSERHVVYAPTADTYMIFYELGNDGDNAINATYWQTIGGVGFWSFPFTPSDPEHEADSGRPSAHETSEGVAVAYHATDGSGYNLWFNRFDFASTSWGEPTPVTTGSAQSAFPFLDRSSNGTWFIVGTRGEGTVEIIVATSTDDGNTWNEQVLAAGLIDTWVLPSGAADPSNGDIYICYGNDMDEDDDGDAVVQRSTDDGVTWSPPQVVAQGAPGAQKALPSMVIDRDHGVHIVLQSNISDSYIAGLSGFSSTGPIGVPEYVSGVFSGDEWIEEHRMSLMNREELAALPDSCDFEPTPETVATDTVAAFPQIGIQRQPGGDVLVVACPSPYMAVASEGGWNLCGGAHQVWLQELVVGESEWTPRRQISAISEEDAAAGRNTIYSHITHEISAESGIGVAWSEMFGGTSPADVMFVRVYPVGIEGDGDAADGAPGPAGTARLLQNRPNPFNPSTRICFELAQAGAVELTIYDAAGRRVQTLLRSDSAAAGKHVLHWNGRGDTGAAVASGVYFYRLRTDREVLTRSMLLVK
jgi:hypothetical protein